MLFIDSICCHAVQLRHNVFSGCQHLIKRDQTLPLSAKSVACKTKVRVSFATWLEGSQTKLHMTTKTRTVRVWFRETRQPASITVSEGWVTPRPEWLPRSLIPKGGMTFPTKCLDYSVLQNSLGCLVINFGSRQGVPRDLYLSQAHQNAINAETKMCDGEFGKYIPNTTSRLRLESSEHNCDRCGSTSSV